jgi:hypothetical protein
MARGHGQPMTAKIIETILIIFFARHSCHDPPITTTIEPVDECSFVHVRSGSLLSVAMNFFTKLA